MLSHEPCDLFSEKRMISPEPGDLRSKSRQNVVRSAGWSDEPRQDHCRPGFLGTAGDRDTDMDD